MFAFLLNVIIIAIVMKIFFRYMYPKPPKHFFPKEGDDTSIRRCDYCHHELATYRGILQMTDNEAKEYFFCNEQHQANFFAGKTYDPNESDDIKINHK